MSILTYSNAPSGKNVLTAVVACGGYGSVRRTDNCAQLRRRHFPYGASTAPFAWSRTFNVCQGGQPEEIMTGAEDAGAKAIGTTRFDAPSKSETGSNTPSLLTLKRILVFPKEVNVERQSVSVDFTEINAASVGTSPFVFRDVSRYADFWNERDE